MAADGSVSALFDTEATVKSAIPQRDGVGASVVVLPAGPWATVLEFLQQRFPGVTPAEWRSRMERGCVLDGGGSALGPASAYARGAQVHYYRELPVETPIPFEAQILFQDGHLLAVDKPHFLPVLPSGRFLQQTLLVRLKKQLGLVQLAPLHRLDRGTAGVVLFSTNAATRGAYQTLFAQRQVSKVYEALAASLDPGGFPQTRRSRLVPGEPFFRMCEVDGTPNTETSIEVAETRGALSLYRLRPLTGRKHQLRVHLAALGAPIVNDPLYPELQPVSHSDFSHPLKLLARSVAFTDPLNGSTRHFESARAL
jgi:tRNA pseudouridine32 synthase/23S rRNA pseudouridine746 synthase